MKRLISGLFMSFLMLTEANCLIKVGDLLDPTSECGLDFERFYDCLKIDEKSTVSAEKKARAFCYAIKGYAEATENIIKKNNSINKLSSINQRKLEQIKSDVKKMDESRKPFREELLKVNITPDQLSKIPTRSIVNKEILIQCSPIEAKGKYYLGGKLRSGVIDPKSSCGLNHEKLQECIEHDRGAEGQGESFCNDIKLYAGNKYKLLEFNGLPSGKFKEQMIAGILETQNDLEWRFVKKEELLTKEQLKNIDPLGDMQKFTCSGKSDLKGSLENKGNSLKRKINVPFEDTIGLRDPKRTCGLDLSKIKECKKSDNEKLRTFCGEVEEYASEKFYLNLYKTKAAKAVGQEKKNYEDSLAKLEGHQHQVAESLENSGLTKAQVDNIPPLKEGAESTFLCKPIPSMRSSQSRSEFRSSTKRAFN